jgi:HAMP domain-containing protein
MRLQTRIRLATLSIAVLPLCILASFLYLGHHHDVTSSTLAHLVSIASVQRGRVTLHLEQERERLALIASRTQLRRSLASFLHSPNDADQQRMGRILQDACDSIDDLEQITAYDLQGRPVAASDPRLLTRPYPEPELLARARLEAAVDIIHLDEAGEPRAWLTGPLLLQGQTLGVLLVRARLDALFEAIGDRSGLGETGETILLRGDPEQQAQFLAPTRFRPGAVLQPLRSRSPEGERLCSIEPGESLERCVDYRCTEVFASSVAIPGTDWQLIVKMDRSEALAGLGRDALFTLGALALLTFGAFLVSSQLARALTLPIQRLRGATRKIAHGDFTRRLDIRRPDELGELAADFDRMTTRLAESREQLQAKIAELDEEVQRRIEAECAAEDLIEDLRHALADIKRLEGIIPICSSCKKIRDDQGYWEQLEVFFTEHSDARFSHGLCPECFEAALRELDEEDARRAREARQAGKSVKPRRPPKP